MLTISTVHQERILSPGVIQFTRQELRWECHVSSFCEYSVTQRPFPAFRKRSSAMLTSRLKWHIQWHKIVKEYCQKSLTYSSDIFVALQSLAKKGSTILGNYREGLRESTLLYSLTRRSISPCLLRPQPWHAPTWSRVSAVGEMDFPALRRNYPQTFTTIISAGVKAVGDDSTGEISDASLITKGMCMLGSFHLNWSKTFNSVPSWLALLICLPNWPESHPHDYLSHTLRYRQNNM
jgi:hypothetical protein